MRRSVPSALRNAHLQARQRRQELWRRREKQREQCFVFIRDLLLLCCQRLYERVMTLSIMCLLSSLRWLVIPSRRELLQESFRITRKEEKSISASHLHEHSRLFFLWKVNLWIQWEMGLPWITSLTACNSERNCAKDEMFSWAFPTN